MNNSEIRSLYGLKYNPFLPDVPPEALYAIPDTERFAQRVQAMAAQGGFALITDEPGLGKSKTLQQVANRLEQVPDLSVGVMQRSKVQWVTFTANSESCSRSACRRPIAMAASNHCAPAGKITASPPCCDRCCSSMRPSRCRPIA